MTTQFMFRGADPTFNSDSSIFRGGEAEHFRPTPTVTTARARGRFASTVVVALLSVTLPCVAVASTAELYGASDEGLNVASTSPGDDETIAAINRAPMSAAAKAQAQGVIQTFAELAEGVDVFAYALEEGGLAIELENESNGRCLTYVFTESGRSRFVVAEDDDRHWSGRVSRERGDKVLARWLAGDLDHPKNSAVEWA